LSSLYLIKNNYMLVTPPLVVYSMLFQMKLTMTRFLYTQGQIIEPLIMLMAIFTYHFYAHFLRKK
ncbi:hypothetical protein AOA57_20795, partial [Pseudomonas sp. 2588-5]